MLEKVFAVELHREGEEILGLLRELQTLSRGLSGEERRAVAKQVVDRLVREGVL